MEKKFELTDNFIINALGVKLFQIRCTRKIKYANVGDLGGYIEKEENLSQGGNAWVLDNANVYGNAYVFDNADIYGNAWVCGKAKIRGDAHVGNDNQHCGFDCFGSVNRHTHAYLTKDGTVEITCGCFRGNIEQFEEQVERTYGDSKYGREYKAIIEVIKIKFGLNGKEKRI